MVDLSNPNLPLPSVDTLLQYLVFVLDLQILSDVGCLVSGHLAVQLLILGLSLRTLLIVEMVGRVEIRKCNNVKKLQSKFCLTFQNGLPEEVKKLLHARPV